jgi:hypothetical protein
MADSAPTPAWNWLARSSRVATVAAEPMETIAATYAMCSTESKLQANGDDRRIEYDPRRHRNLAGQLSVSINRQPGFLEVNEELEVVGDRTFDTALQGEAKIIEDDEI